MEVGDLLFVRGDSIITKLIQMFDGQYSHVAIYVGHGKILEAQAPNNSRIINNYHKDYDLMRIYMNYDQQQLVKDIAIRLCDFPYDYKKIFGYALERLFNFDRRNFWDSTDRLICSELTDAVLYLTGVIPDSAYVGDRTPNEQYKYLKSIGY